MRGLLWPQTTGELEFIATNIKITLAGYLAKCNQSQSIPAEPLRPLTHLHLFADFGKSLWYAPNTECPHDLLPAQLLEDIEVWETMLWEDAGDYRYCGHMLTREQYNDRGRALARRIKQALPYVEVTFGYWSKQFTDEPGCELETEVIR